MPRRYITADFLHPVSAPVIPGGILVIDEKGVVLEVVDPLREAESHRMLLSSAELERYKGHLVPGFINAHCHLELSHLRGRLTRGTGLPGFLKEVVRYREVDLEEAEDAMQKADEEMHAGGIVAVCDISNTVRTLNRKRNSSIHYHTFVELFDLHPTRAEQEWERGQDVLRQFQEAGFTANLVPHAMYTVSEVLMRRLAEASTSDPFPISIHIQESASEDQMFVNGDGPLMDMLKGTGWYDDFQPTRQGVMPTLMQRAERASKILLVHDTFTRSSDLSSLVSRNDNLSSHAAFCLCPGANLFIEGRLPDLNTLSMSGFPLLLGTDSLASNDGLSIVNEMNTLIKAKGGLDFETVLRMATWNAAYFLNWQSRWGSLEVGKQPGVNLLGLNSSGTVTTVRRLDS